MVDTLNRYVPLATLLLAILSVTAAAVIYVHTSSSTEADNAAAAIQQTMDTKLKGIEENVKDIKITVKSLDVQMRDVREWKAVTDRDVKRCILHIDEQP